ncbi:hypothetical protein PFISCL1PPCAC_22400, partial [Pristionchus fissidentatus]
SSLFDVSSCSHGKGCFLPNDCVPGAATNSCSLAFSFRPIDDNSVEMELYGTIESGITVDSFYLAVGFSDDEKMGDEAVTECSRLVNEAAPSVKASYNYFHDEAKKTGVDNRRIEGEETFRPSLYSSPVISTAEGVVYCKFTQKIGGMQNMKMEYLVATKETSFHFLLAKGGTTNTGLKSHGHKGTATSTAMKFSETGSSASSFSLLFIAMVSLASSAFSVRSFIKPFSSVSSFFLSLAAAAATAPFDVSTCGHGKGCFLPDDCTIGATDGTACSLAYSFRPIDNHTIEMELYGTIEKELTESNFWIAVGFSDDDKMGDDPTTECSRMENEAAPSVKASYNFYKNKDNKKRKPSNRRIDGEEKTRHSIYSTSSIKTVDGVIYCKFTQKIGGLGKMAKEYLTTDTKTPFYFLIAKGATRNNELGSENRFCKVYKVDIVELFQTGSTDSLSLFFVAIKTVLQMIF